MALDVVTRAAIWIVVLIAAFGPNYVRAFCRESVKTPTSGPCMEKEGVPLLHWTRPCVTYVFNAQLFSRLPLLTETEIRETFSSAFLTWADVDCSGRAPFFVEQSAGVTQTTNAEFVFNERNEAVIVARTRREWDALPGHDPTAIALTLVWHDKDTGEILDVDMELNTGASNFANCDRGCGGSTVDLSNTITHEAGHLLGLGHTSVRGATMTTTAIGAETEKRTLEADDRKGYCALDLPEFECSDENCVCDPPPIYPSGRTAHSGSCSCRVLGSAGAQAIPAGIAYVGLAVGWIAWRSRRRSRGAAAARS